MQIAMEALILTKYMQKQDSDAHVVLFDAGGFTLTQSDIYRV